VLVMIGDRPWPNFNVADSLLVAGVGVMLLHTFFFEGRAQAPQAPATQ
jgi:lipoprotein signal peptidase